MTNQSKNTPIDIVKQYLTAWSASDYLGVFSAMQISTRFRMPVAAFMSRFLAPPVKFEVFSDEDIEGLDGTVIRDVNITIDFGKGEKPAKLRCVCEKLDKIDGETQFVTASTPDGGQWGVNPFSLRYKE